jgi:O-antigen/teichoic acid export membrane protein
MSLSAEEIGRRAAGGAAVLLARGALILVVGVGANIALAHLLAPRDFGLVALGSVLLVLGSLLSDAGLGVGLIRRAEPPTRRELEAVNGVQLSVTTALALVAVAVAVPLGREGWVVAVMTASLPVAMLKAPSMILLERGIQYRAVATVDLVEAGTFYAWALTTVALGAGVWGFATAVVVRAIVGAGLMLRIGPLGPIRPRWAAREMRPLIVFGTKFQASYAVSLVGNQLVNVAVAAIAGVAALGVWNLTWRVLQIPTMVFANFGRIGFPAMARLLEAGQHPRPVLERGGAALAVISATMMVALIGFAPALPGVLGPGWHDVPSVVFWAGIAMIAILPLIFGCSPYLLAVDAAGAVLRSAVMGAVAGLVVTLPLLSALGAVAAAIGWCVAAFVQLTMLGAAAKARSGAALVTSVGFPVAIGIAAAIAAWFVAQGAGSSVGAGLLGVAVGEAVLLVTLAVLRRPALRDTRGWVGQAVGRLAAGAQPSPTQGV